MIFSEKFYKELFIDSIPQLSQNRKNNNLILVKIAKSTPNQKDWEPSAFLHLSKICCLNSLSDFNMSKNSLKKAFIVF